jgi:hypothetical protein
MTILSPLVILVHAACNWNPSLACTGLYRARSLRAENCLFDAETIGKLQEYGFFQMRKKTGTTKRLRSKPRQLANAGSGPPSEAPSAENLPGAVLTRAMAASGAKSLMKTSELRTGRVAPRRSQPVPNPSPAAIRQGKSASVISGGQRQKIEERIAAATEELSAGITEAASAAQELRRSMEQIASGAEEAASAAQETLAVANNTAATLNPCWLRRRARSEPGPVILSITATAKPEPSTSWRS